MAEGGGHDVGALRLRIIPFLDQAASQQVNQQAQSAFSGIGMRVGGGGGGGGGGPPVLFNPGVPGGGSSGGSSYNSVIQSTVNNAYNRYPAQNQNQNQGMFGGRGLNRAIMQGMFGAFEVGRAGTAFAAAGQETAMRGSRAGMNAYMHAADAASSGIFGSIVRGGMEGFEALTGREFIYGSPTAARRAIYEAEQGDKDVAARSGRMLDNERSRVKLADARDDRIRGRITNKYEAAMTAADQSADKVKRDYRIGLLERQRAVADADDPREHHRAELELSRYSLNESQMIPEARKTAGITKNEINRRMGIDARALARQGRVFQAEAGGNFGEADERAFQNDLADRMDDARAAGGVFPMLQRGINAMAGDARRGKQRLAAGASDAAARVTRDLISGGWSGRQKATLDASDERLRQIKATSSPEEMGSDLNAEAWRRKKDSTDLKNEQLDTTAGFARRLQSSRILADRNYNFSTAGHVADAYGITQGGIDAADALSRRGYKSEAATTRATAQSDLEVLKRQYLSSFAPAEVDINRVATSGGGAADMVSVLKSIDDGIKKLVAAGGATAQ